MEKTNIEKRVDKVDRHIKNELSAFGGLFFLKEDNLYKGIEIRE